MLEIAQLLDYIGDSVFLEQTDGGDAGGAGVEAGAGVLQHDSAQGQDRDVCFASLFQQG